MPTLPPIIDGLTLPPDFPDVSRDTPAEFSDKAVTWAQWLATYGREVAAWVQVLNQISAVNKANVDEAYTSSNNALASAAQALVNANLVLIGANYRGEINAITYSLGDVVSGGGGSFYISKTNNNTNYDFNTNYWQLIPVLPAGGDGQMLFRSGGSWLSANAHLTRSFSSSTTYTLPAYCKAVFIEAWGGGGGGERSDGGRAAGGGGGGYNAAWLPLNGSPEQYQLVITIGAGGAGVASVPSGLLSFPGGNGGDTIVSFSGLPILRAYGGAGGYGRSALTYRRAAGGNPLRNGGGIYYSQLIGRVDYEGGSGGSAVVASLAEANGESSALGGGGGGSGADGVSGSYAGAGGSQVGISGGGGPAGTLDNELNVGGSRQGGGGALGLANGGLGGTLGGGGGGCAAPNPSINVFTSGRGGRGGVRIVIFQ